MISSSTAGKRSRTKVSKNQKLLSLQNAVEQPLPGDLLYDNMPHQASAEISGDNPSNMQPTSNNYAATNIGENITNIEVNQNQPDLGEYQNQDYLP